MIISLFITMALWLSLLIEVRMIIKKLVREEGGWGRDEPAYTEGEISKPIWVLLILLFSVVFLLVGYWHGCYTLTVPMHMYFLWAVPVRVFIFWLVHELTDEKAFLQKLPKLGTGKVIALGVTLAIVVILGAVWPAFVLRTISFTRANVMKSKIDDFKEGTKEMFPEIRPETLRLTTSGIAESIAKTKKTSAASYITGTHLGSYNNTLCWMSTISETPFWGWLVGDSNRIREVIIVPVTDSTGEKVTVLKMEMRYAEGLWFDKNIEVHASDRFPFRTFTRGYITMNEKGKLVYVTTSYFRVPFGALEDPKIHVWDFTTGDLLGEYDPHTAPEWVVQRWDEEYVETMGSEFGYFRKTADNDLDYSVGIFYQSDRAAEPSEPEGLRYQKWEEETTAVYIFDNKRNEDVMELLMIATKRGMTSYAMDKLQFIGADDAKETALSGLPQLSGDRTYSTPIALIYRVGAEVYYHVPVYTYSDRHYYPAYFVLVRAHDRFLIREPVGEHGGMVGAIKAVYEKLGAPVGPTPTEITAINGTLVYKDSYTKQGNQRWVLGLKLNDGRVVELLAKAETLTDKEISKILKMQVGDPAGFFVDTENIVVNVP